MSDSQTMWDNGEESVGMKSFPGVSPHCVRGCCWVWKWLLMESATKQKKCKGGADEEENLTLASLLNIPT